MYAATDAVCLALSDEEDYVSFDEAEMEQGIQELYSDDSASDAGSDISNPDNNFDDLNDAPLLDTLLESNVNNNSNNNDNNNNNANDDLFASMEPLPQVSSQQSQVISNDSNNNNKNSNNKRRSSLLGMLFGSSDKNDKNENENKSIKQASKDKKPKSKSKSMRKKKNKRRSAFNDSMSEEEDETDSDEEETNFRSLSHNRGAADYSVSHAYNSNVNNSNANSSAKSEKVTKLQKRLRRLSDLRRKKESKKEKKGRRVIHRQKVNTNVISINLGTLKESALQVVAGDPIFCKNEKCKTTLSIHDKLLDKLEKTESNNEELKVDSENGEYIWVCQFCNTVNVIEIDDEGEKPKGETLDYVIEPPSEAKQNDDDGLIIFCIDVSGSMCVTQEVKGKFQLKGDHISSQLNEFSQFIDAGDRLNQFLPNQNRDVTWVSRLQAVQAAVDEQIAAIKKQKPKFKIALVSFANDVVIVGDGIQNTEVVAGDKLNDLEKLQEIGRKYAVDNTVDKSYENLSDALWKLKESGQTALGPALAVSIAMAERKRGSQVILCTDGLANVGVGSLDISENENNNQNNNNNGAQVASAVQAASGANEEMNDEEAPDAVETIEKWYENLGMHAMEKGVIVNVISITDDGCRLENLGKLTDACNGNIKRINPLKLTEKFSGILGNDLLATRTQATMYLHPGLQFFSSIETAADAEQIAAANKDADNQIEDLLNLVDIGVEKPKQAQAQAQSQAAASNETVADNSKDTVKKTDTTEKKEESSKDTESKVESKTESKDESNEKKDDSGNGRKIEIVSRETQDVGNVFDTSELFFEYSVRKSRIPEFRGLTHLPFQCHIEYEKLDGTKMLRVITQLRPVVLDRRKVRERVNVDILAKYGTKVTTELCSKGDYESSRAFTQANTVWMQRNIHANNANNNLNKSKYRSQMISLANYANYNMALDHQMKTQIATESMAAPDEDEFGSFSPNIMNSGIPPPPQPRYMPQQQQQQAFRPMSYNSGMTMNSNSMNSYNAMNSYSNSNNNSNNYGGSHNNRSKKKSKAKSRRAARNDKFSSAMYRMKKK